MTAGHFEAKKHAIRQTQDGWVVSFVVHPNDMGSAFATAPLGTRYMVGFAEIGDDEKPMPPPATPVLPDRNADGGQGAAEARSSTVERAAHNGQVAGSTPAAPTAARSEQAKMAYRNMPPAEQARCRAGRLPENPRFRAWAAMEINPSDPEIAVTVAEAEQFIRRVCCHGHSRSLIVSVPEYLDRFLAMELAFKIAVGEVAEPR